MNDLAMINQAYLSTGCQRKTIEIITAPTPPETRERVHPRREWALKREKARQDAEDALRQHIEKAELRLAKWMNKGVRAGRLTPIRKEIRRLRAELRLLTRKKRRTDPFAQYKAKVWELTNKQPLDKLEGFKNRSWKGMHVDHVLSIREAFDRKLPSETVAHISNLRMIPADVNMAKGTKTVYTNLFNEG